MKSIDLLKEKNRELHHTSDFEQDDLVIRRGQAFSLALNFDRNPHVEEDIITLLITTGMSPVERVWFKFFFARTYLWGWLLGNT